MTDAESKSSQHSFSLGRVRWRELALIFLTALACLAAIWLPERFFRDHRLVFTMITGAIVYGAVCIWLLFRSRLPPRVRWGGGGAMLGLVLLAAATLRLEGFHGNMLPNLNWRWAPTLDERFAERYQAPGLEPAADEKELPVPQVDHSGFLGGDRSGIVPGIKLKTDWQTHPPRELWRRPVGLGWSGFATSGLRAVTLEQRGEQETIACYALDTGEELWSRSRAVRFTSFLGGDGPRSTPSIAQGRVYALGATGWLDCLNLEDGSLLWSKNILQDNGAEVPRHGATGSPLLYREWVVVNAGGPAGHSLTAYDRESGERVWHGGSDVASYASPQPMTLCGQPQILSFNGHGLAGHDAQTGKLLWDYPWVTDSSLINVAQPRAVRLEQDETARHVLVSSGYDVGTGLLQLSQREGTWQAKEVWHTRALKSKFSNVIVKDGYAYGLNLRVLVCLALEDGRMCWKGRYGHGQLLLIGQTLLIQCEDGSVALVEATARRHRELARMRVLSSRTWNHPAAALPYLLVRNDREAACYLLPVER